MPGAVPPSRRPQTPRRVAVGASAGRGRQTRTMLEARALLFFSSQVSSTLSPVAQYHKPITLLIALHQKCFPTSTDSAFSGSQSQSV